MSLRCLSSSLCMVIVLINACALAHSRVHYHQRRNQELQLVPYPRVGKRLEQTSAFERPVYKIIPYPRVGKRGDDFEAPIAVYRRPMLNTPFDSWGRMDRLRGALRNFHDMTESKRSYNTWRVPYEGAWQGPSWQLTPDWYRGFLMGKRSSMPTARIGK